MQPQEVKTIWGREQDGRVKGCVLSSAAENFGSCPDKVSNLFHGDGTTSRRGRDHTSVVTSACAEGGARLFGTQGQVLAKILLSS